ncbi:WD40 repeat domain-containing protein [Blastopirellula marina]|nr:WD40 repeat domain-containing protein [Blastopirellula marina]
MRIEIVFALMIGSVLSAASCQRAQPTQLPPVPPIAVDFMGAKKMAFELDQRIEEAQPMRVQEWKQLSLPASKNLIVKASGDGKFLVGASNEHGIVGWDIESDQQKWIVPNAGDQHAVRFAVTRNGDKVLVGMNDGQVHLLNGTNGERLASYPQLPDDIRDLRFSPNENYVGAVDMGFNSFVTPIKKEDCEIDSWRVVHVGSYHGPKLAIQDNGTWAKIRNSDGRVEVLLSDEKGDVQTFEKPAEKDRINRPMIAAGSEGFLWNVVGTIYCGQIQEGELKAEPIYENNQVPYDAAFSEDEQRLWQEIFHCLYIFDFPSAKKLAKAPLPRLRSRSDFQFLPEARRIVVVGYEDSAVHIWKVEGDTKSIDVTVQETVEQWLADQRFDAIEELARRWDGKTEGLGPTRIDTPYSRLVLWVAEYQFPDRSEEEQLALYHGWIEQQPDKCQFMRIALAYYYKYVDRDEDKHFLETTPKDWAETRVKLDKGLELIEPLLEQKRVPAEAYVMAINICHIGRSREHRVDPLIQDALRDWPAYYRIYGEHAGWIRMRDSTFDSTKPQADFAKRAADHLGGEEGDMLYARIYYRNFISISFDGTDGQPFSPERLAKGFVVLAEKTEDTEAMSFGLAHASRIGDETSAQAIANRLVELGTTMGPIFESYDEKLVNKVLDQAEQNAAAQ